MYFRSLLLSSLLVATHARDALPACCLMTDDTVPTYHTDAQCDRVAHNSPEKKYQRLARKTALEQTIGFSNIPNQHTVICPETPVSLEPENANGVGMDTTWIVENKSSGNVVIAYVENGVEYSAVHPNITPPQADPDAILPVGKWLAINTFEGHVFHVRELKADGTTGNILLQHRPGMISFTNRFQQSQELPEPTAVRMDPPPAHNTTKYARTPAHSGERCNIVYQGFRNGFTQPLNVYYVGMQEPHVGPMQCNERFKFHLGLEESKSSEEWASRVKFEASFMGHSFVARLASNEDIVVDAVTLQPTQIQDCPNLKQQVPIGSQIQMIEADGVQHGIENNATGTMNALNITNNRFYVMTTRFTM